MLLKAVFLLLCVGFAVGATTLCGTPCQQQPCNPCAVQQPIVQQPIIQPKVYPNPCPCPTGQTYCSQCPPSYVNHPLGLSNPLDTAGLGAGTYGQIWPQPNIVNPTDQWQQPSILNPWLQPSNQWQQPSNPWQQPSNPWQQPSNSWQQPTIDNPWSNQPAQTWQQPSIVNPAMPYMAQSSSGLGQGGFVGKK